MFDNNVSNWIPESHLIIATSAMSEPQTFCDLVQDAVESIKNVMRIMAVTTVSSSYGKDSSVIVALAIEAATQMRAEGVQARVRIMTSDTLVDSPAMIRLAKAMSAQALELAEVRGLDIEQIWVQPDPIDHYMVKMIGGRGVASVAGSDAACSVDLKIRPMAKVSRQLAKQYGEETICNLIGTRFEESAERAKNMRKRNESATAPVQQDSGLWQMSPIADWTTAEVWQLLNGTNKSIGFETLDFTKTIAVYEAMGEFTCETVEVNTSVKAKSPCSGGRGGCVVCQKVTVDTSMNALLDSYPYLAPLARLSRVIQAGHFMPENRMYMGKSADANGLIRVFANSYSIDWQIKLLQWSMTIDEREDEYVQAKAEKLGRRVERRFGRLLQEEHMLLIAFSWARYGFQRAGQFARIREAIAQGARYDMPTDEEIEAMKAKADRKSAKLTAGYLQTKGLIDSSAFRDNWRDLIGADSGCAPAVMVDANGDRDRYVSGTGTVHDSMGQADVVSADLSAFQDADGNLTQDYEDFMWWYASEFAGGAKSSSEEMAFLVRHGVIKARAGYQSQLANYQAFNHVLSDLRVDGSIDTLEQIQNHPQFLTVEESGEIKAANADEHDAPARIEEEQLDLFAA
jgi:DNA sulfur modification protein DndC